MRLKLFWFTINLWNILMFHGNLVAAQANYNVALNQPSYTYPNDPDVCYNVIAYPEKGVDGICGTETN